MQNLDFYMMTSYFVGSKGKQNIQVDGMGVRIIWLHQPLKLEEYLVAKCAVRYWNSKAHEEEKKERKKKHALFVG